MPSHYRFKRGVKRTRAFGQRSAVGKTRMKFMTRFEDASSMPRLSPLTGRGSARQRGRSALPGRRRYGSATARNVFKEHAMLPKRIRATRYALPFGLPRPRKVRPWEGRLYRGVL